MQIEDALKALIREQVKLTERVIYEFLNAIMKEIREIVLVHEVGDETEWEEAELDLEAEEEFYDVKSLDSDLEECDIDFNLDEKGQIGLISRSINKRLNVILNLSYVSTKKYLKEYCEMQKELIHCDDEEFIKVIREYYLQDKVIEVEDEEVKLKNILSQSEEEIKLMNNSIDLDNINIEGSHETNGFLKEFMALLFPSPTNFKRVEYRPRPIDLSIINRQKPEILHNNRDEILLLKLLEIYMKSHQKQLKSFLPKCVNYHLIGRILRELPLQLLKIDKITSDGCEGEIENIKNLIKLIDSITRIN